MRDHISSLDQGPRAEQLPFWLLADILADY
jgi:hypothetical protein